MSLGNEKEVATMKHPFSHAVVFGLALWILTTTLVAVCTYAASLIPAYAGTLDRGEVVVCNAGPRGHAVRIWEDGSASCIRRSTYKWHKWDGMKAGDYVKCWTTRHIIIEDGFAAHCRGAR